MCTNLYVSVEMFVSATKECLQPWNSLQFCHFSVHIVLHLLNIFKVVMCFRPAGRTRHGCLETQIHQKLGVKVPSTDRCSMSTQSGGVGECRVCSKVVKRVHDASVEVLDLARRWLWHQPSLLWWHSWGSPSLSFWATQDTWVRKDTQGNKMPNMKSTCTKDSYYHTMVKYLCSANHQQKANKE